VERKHLQDRIRSARVWVERFAGEDEKTKLQESLPARARELTAAQRGFLHGLAEVLPTTAWEDEALQAMIFETSRLTPIEQPLAFKAIYRVLLDREAGPKAGNLLAFLERDFVVQRLREVPFDRAEFWRATAITPEEVERWLDGHREKLASHEVTTRAAGELSVIEVTITLLDGKKHLRRALTQSVEGTGLLARLEAVPAGGSVA
jgi:lysyl-tRNA synthetase class 1